MFQTSHSLLKGAQALTPRSRTYTHRIRQTHPAQVTRSTFRWATSSRTDEDSLELGDRQDILDGWREHPSVNPKLEFPTILVPVESLTLLVPKLQPYLAKNSEVAKHVHPRIKMVKDHSDTHKLILITNEAVNNDGNDNGGGDIIDHLTDSLELGPGTIQRGPMLDMDVSYSQLSYQYILSKLLTPMGIPIPTSYEQIGHIAHFNLKPIHEPYGKLIAEVLTETNPTIETVVTKVGEVHGDYRTYDFDVLAGPEKLETTVVEHGVKIELHLGECYWSNRLGGERQVLIQDILNPSAVPPKSVAASAEKKGTSDTGDGERELIVADAFSGVGAVCLLLAKQAPEIGKNVTILANDWNPKAIEYFQKSIHSNSGMDSDRFFLSQGDAYDFLMDLGTGGIGGGKLKKGKKKKKKGPPGGMPDHVLMNFPLHGPTYLGALRWWQWKHVQKFYHMHNTYPRFHVYTFAKDIADKDNEEEIALDIIADELLPAMNTPRNDDDDDDDFDREGEKPGRHRRREMDNAFGTQFSTRMVRDVAPGKVVVCVSFFLTPKLIRYMQGEYE
ncbi:unnamed protein product [Cylindrotheca closterium]|uniref:tRNA (guanine(37)-N1)-methyltransferase n=1 Tax=Cylindrotheca closterium TaxID=2856 RepID=A0AAD2CUC0_9STRA|nr:unnamed protein product [Cylindrotheca closterium]